MTLRLLGWVFLLACCCLADPHFEAAGEKAGLAGVTGKVETGSAGRWKPAQIGDLVAPGQSVRTGPKSVAIVVLDDLTSLRLGASSELSIVSLTDGAGQARLASGRAWVNANPAGAKTTFELHGPNAVAAVKGTSFEMNVKGTQTRVRVWHGQVWCHLAEQKQTQTLGVGQEYTALAAEARVREVAGTPDAWQAWNQACDHEVEVVALAETPPDEGEVGGSGGDKAGQPAPQIQRPPAAIVRTRVRPVPRPSRLSKLFLQQLNGRLPAPPP